MSTILKALKRIDQTTPEPEEVQAWPSRIDTKETFKTRLSRVWLQRKVVLTVIFAVILIIAGGLIYSQKHRLVSQDLPAKASEKTPIYQAKINPNPNGSQNSAREKPASINRRDSQPRPQLPGNDAASKPLSRLQGPQRPAANRIYSAPRDTRPPSKQTTVESEISRSQPTAPGNSSQSSQRLSATSPAQKTTSKTAPVGQSYRRMSDPKLKLQAIAWSEDAGKRIAVINGHVVREGETVEGFSVNQIRQEDVIVNDGTESWQLEFGLQ